MIGGPVTWIFLLIIGILVIQALSKNNQKDAYIPPKQGEYLQSYEVPVNHGSKASRTPQKNFCIECGGKIGHNDIFCRFCGTDQRI